MLGPKSQKFDVSSEKLNSAQCDPWWSIYALSLTFLFFILQANSIKSSEGLIALTKAILAAGAQCVVVTLWPVPDSAVNLVMKPLYSALLQGTRISRAMADAIITVQNTKHFAHPANWSGFALIGKSIF